MENVRLAACGGALCMRAIEAGPWRALTGQLVLIAQMLLIILLAVPLGSFTVYLLAHAAVLPHRLRLNASKRRAIAQWTTEQRIAVLEAANGHGVLWEGACPSCRAALVMHARFCSSCGGKVSADDGPEVIVCRLCYETNPARGRFCWHCGQRLYQSVA